MLSALIVSDMYGRRADTTYLAQWSAALAGVGVEAYTIFTDDLLPDVYANWEIPADIHATLVQPKVCGEAVSRLEEVLIARQPSILIGFSYGGYLAFEARHVLRQAATLVCISATRLRKCLPISSPPMVNALFGDTDPFRPRLSETQSSGGVFYHEKLIGEQGHELYKDIGACLSFVQSCCLLPPAFASS